MRLFDDVKVGDVLYDVHGGEWEVTEVEEKKKWFKAGAYKTESEYWFDFDGELDLGHSFGQQIFHTPPTLTVPPRPKKKVQHTITRWAQIIRSHRPDGFRVENISDFDESCQTDATWYPCTITFETEEP